ncbi:MAG TPA: hypothetical protein VH083_01875 [Myxococcales bacterium]|nr:hypothetical protein [Myxococcales bacterium]
MKRIVIGAALAAGIVFACSSSGPSGPTGGPVPGAADTHCALPDGGTTVQVTHQSSCTIVANANATADYGATMFNAEGDDDDCKYHVKFSSTDIRENSNFNLIVSATNKTDGSAVTGANVDPEIFLNNTHPAPNSNFKTVESPAGTYTIGPLQFDAPGEWTVRFHFFEQCDDNVDDSPHGHAAFFVEVP